VNIQDPPGAKKFGLRMALAWTFLFSVLCACLTFIGYHPGSTATGCLLLAGFILADIIWPPKYRTRSYSGLVAFYALSLAICVVGSFVAELCIKVAERTSIGQLSAEQRSAAVGHALGLVLYTPYAVGIPLLVSLIAAVWYGLSGLIPTRR
jgi:hypothetical protein